MTEKRRAPIELLERLAEAVDKWAAASEYFDGENAVSDMLRAYRAATAPLRTRQEVDAEIVSEARLYWQSTAEATIKRHDVLERLCSEPIADDKEPK